MIPGRSRTAARLRPAAIRREIISAAARQPSMACFESDSFITKVDVAPNPELVGTEQVRFWKIIDGKLHITTAPLPNPNSRNGTLIGTLVWERE
jgi:hypothetical protein